jgi:hypothetical protein
VRRRHTRAAETAGRANSAAVGVANEDFSVLADEPGWTAAGDAAIY